MKSSFPWLACAVALGFAAFAGCGGGAEGDAGDGSAAGESNAGTGGGSAGKGSSQGGSANSGAGESSSAGESSVVLPDGGASSQGGQASAAGAPSVVAGAPGAGGAGADPCGGCNAPLEICVYQVGGPGPSHYTCATQNPCGAAGACACIVDQGPCENMLMGDPPNYCVCDNGLD